MLKRILTQTGPWGALVLVLLSYVSFTTYKISLGVGNDSLLTTGTYVDTSASEKTRIQNRLKLIEGLLRGKDVSDLPPHLQLARSRNLDMLHVYWKKGDFPKNTNRLGERMPFFIDAYGTPCAVGYLMIQSGHEQIAREIAAQDNTIYADQIKFPAFSSWADSSGLTTEELFLIHEVTR